MSTLASALRALALFSLAATLSAADWPLPAAEPAAEGFSPARLDQMHRNLGALVDRGQYAGYVTILARHGRIVDTRSYGFLDAATHAPMPKDAIVRIYSMSKIMTSAGILMLLEDGKLQLADPVEKYLPALKNRKVLVGGTADAPLLADAERPITIVDLLTHTAGYYYDASWSADSEVCIELMRRAELWEATNLDDFVRRLAPVPLHEQPGKRFRYGINTDLLGAIIEKASGLPLGEFLQQRLFGPLGLRDTGFSVAPEKRARLSMLYQIENGKLGLAARQWPRPDGSHVQSGGGGLFSTAADYVRFAQMLANGGQLDGVRVLGRKSVEFMTRNHLVTLASPHPGRPEQGFGLGVRMITDLGAGTTLGSVGTFGWDGAATTTVQIDPQEHTVAIILTQNLTFNQDGIFETFTNGYYAALVD